MILSRCDPLAMKSYPQGYALSGNVIHMSLSTKVKR